MNRWEVTDGILSATLYEAWVLASNRRNSGCYPEWTNEPTIHSLIVESVKVAEEHRKEGRCKRFLSELCGRTDFDLVVVEGVQNAILAEALLRWGWDCDPGVSDFFWERGKHCPF